MTSFDVRAFKKPFNHAVIDNFLEKEVVAQINREWPGEEMWAKKAGKTSMKWDMQNLPTTAKSVVECINASHIPLVEEVTGIQGLMADPTLFGAGLHAIPPGGFLKMHVDFNRHPKGWHRRVNMLIYLNEDWQEEWGGDLQLGISEFRVISPIAGRCVIFETNDLSWHGHPFPLKCPPDRQRRSLAIYFYTETPPAEPAHTTIYQK